MPQTPDIHTLIIERLRKAVRLIETDLPRMVGKVARDHYQDNFRKGGFVNGGLHPWKDVKRRDAQSGWNSCAASPTTVAEGKQSLRPTNLMQLCTTTVEPSRCLANIPFVCHKGSSLARAGNSTSR